MKSKLIIAGTSAILAGAVLITFLMKRNKSVKQVGEYLPFKKSHHLTNVFAHAKNHAE